MFETSDLNLFADKGLELSEVERQINLFKTGIPFLEITAAATPGNGILQIEDVEESVDFWEEFLRKKGTVIKFVPASGAATRMFKDLFSFYNASDEYPKDGPVKQFFDKIDNFAFYEDLAVYEETLDSSDRYYFKKLLSRFLEKSGMNYGQLPKGLLKFHKYEKGARTPFEEHWVEGCLYALQRDKNVHIHFTISPQFKEKFNKLEKQNKAEFEKEFGAKIHLSYSVQEPATDTIAVTMENEPFRTGEKKEIMFRPGGHGALIGNLDKLEADVIFVKNIDNVVPDHLKETTVTYKKLIGGWLISLRKQVFAYHKLLDGEGVTKKQYEKMLQFAEESLQVKLPTGILEASDDEKKAFLLSKFDRPLRVCGMVKNEGEPGGGPFWVKNSDGSESLQIAESSQIDLKDTAKKSIFDSATHFNPVDLVLSVKNYKGEKYNLLNYLDESTSFIAYKSSEGRDLKALERPGLWNGAMANWSTIFVEVPLATFNPVKTVNDLLRPEHQ